MAVTRTHTEGEGNTSAARKAWSERRDDAAGDALLARDSAAFLHQSLSTPCAAAITKAEGIWIEDSTGRRYMDFHGNSVHHIGYGHPRVVAAIKDQLDALPFSPRRFANDVAVDLAERLGALAPWPAKVLFTTGGSDANEVAMKIARAATGRFKTLSFWDSYHGAGFGACSIGGEATFRSDIAGPLLPGAEHLAPFHPLRCPYGHDQSVERSADACARMAEYVLGRDGDYAAFVAEAMRAVPVVPPPGFWTAISQTCKRHGALLILDEIPTGLGKTGRMFAHEHDGVVPDIITLGKALGGGILPIAAVLARADLDVAGDYALGHYTHEKNPVTARAALATLDVIEDEGLVERAAALGERALTRLRDQLGSHRHVGDIRGRGAMFGIELVQSRDDMAPANALAEAALYRCLDAGLSFKISAGNVLTLSPPLTLSDTELDSALDIVAQALAA
ncbi:MAG: aspartate aminotransferase family protein [Pseudomonadota bacterium]